MTKLSVNINKIAVIRNSRGGNLPDVVRAATDIERFGAEGSRCIRAPMRVISATPTCGRSVRVLATGVQCRGQPHPLIVRRPGVRRSAPAQVTLVPDAPTPSPPTPDGTR